MLTRYSSYFMNGVISKETNLQTCSHSGYSVYNHVNRVHVYCNDPVFSDAKIIISLKNRGYPKAKGVRKTCFWALKNNYFGEKRGCPKTKGIQKQNVSENMG